MIYDLAELQYKLERARGETSPASKRIRMRTAALDDAYNLLKSGWNPQITAEVLKCSTGVSES
jgi:hypothetical protein